MIDGMEVLAERRARAVARALPGDVFRSAATIEGRREV
jgi:predicted GNAT superfamily acetyltransferase